MKQTKIILSKTIKVPIEGINYSNKVVSATIEYEPKGFNTVEAVDEINQQLTILQEDDPSWISQPTTKEEKQLEI